MNKTQKESLIFDEQLGVPKPKYVKQLLKDEVDFYDLF